MGALWAFKRAAYAAKKKFGLLKLLSPVSKWGANRAPAGIPNLRLEPPFSPEEAAAAFTEPQKKQIAESALGILGGNFEFFNSDVIKTGFPPDWKKNYYQNTGIYSNSHWSEIRQFGGADIKNVWELSRFAWMQTLALAALVCPQKRSDFYRAAVSLFGDWLANNQPNAGVNWNCGQETAIRLVSVALSMRIFNALGLFKNSDLPLLREFFEVSARRILANLPYALSQNNNHGISETVGLIVASDVCGLSPKYRRRGIDALNRQLKSLFYEDGSFSQYSNNYERVALDMLLCAASAEISAGFEIPKLWSGVLARAANFLEMQLNRADGSLPRWGADDGAKILRLSADPYGDFRQTIAACRRASGTPCGFDCSGHSQTSILLFGAAPECRPLAQPGRFLTETGYAGARNKNFFIFTRSGNYRHRVSHEDQMSLWIEFGGGEFVSDPGTFSYNAKPPFDSGFASAEFHNVVAWEGGRYTLKISRFLRLPAPRCSAEFDGDVLRMRAQAGFGADSKCSLGRRVRAAEDCVEVRDSASSGSPRKFCLRWLVNAESAEKISETAAVFETPNGKIRLDVGAPLPFRLEIIKAESGSAQGWISPAYNRLKPAFLAKAELVEAAKSVEFNSIFKIAERI